MPEGPEIRTVARTLGDEVVGQRLGSLWHSHHSLRSPVDHDGLKGLQGGLIDGIASYGKVLFISLDKKTAIAVQLGMTGQLLACHASEPVALHTHLRWQLLGSKRELRYVDPRRFGLIDLCDEAKKKAIIGRLGPDPFMMTAGEVRELGDAMRRSRRPIKDVLLDQSVVAGVGNIYASEALFLAKIDPRRPACDIGREECERLIGAMIEVLLKAYDRGGTTFSNYVDGSGKKGDNWRFLKVFKRHGQPCTVCETLILRIKQAGRSTFYCPDCQG